MRIDVEKDFHHYTKAEMLNWLEDVWSRRQWHSLLRVRVIHGTGHVLYRALREWCDEKGVPWTVEPHNPGVTILHPSRRVLPGHRIGNRSIGRHADTLRQFDLTRARQSNGNQPKAPDNRDVAAPPMEVVSPPCEESGDLMASEFQRLGQRNRREMLRQKHD